MLFVRVCAQAGRDGRRAIRPSEPRADCDNMVAASGSSRSSRSVASEDGTTSGEALGTSVPNRLEKMIEITEQRTEERGREAFAGSIRLLRVWPNVGNGCRPPRASRRRRGDVQSFSRRSGGHDDEPVGTGNGAHRIGCDGSCGNG